MCGLKAALSVRSGRVYHRLGLVRDHVCKTSSLSPFLLWLSVAVSIALQVLICWGAHFDADVLCPAGGGGAFC